MLVKIKKRWHPLLEPLFEGGKMTRKMTTTILMMKLLLAVVDGIVVLGTDFHAGYDALLGIPENRPSKMMIEPVMLLEVGGRHQRGKMELTKCC